MNWVVIIQQSRSVGADSEGAGSGVPRRHIHSPWMGRATPPRARLNSWMILLVLSKWPQLRSQMLHGHPLEPSSSVMLCLTHRGVKRFGNRFPNQQIEIIEEWKPGRDTAFGDLSLLLSLTCRDTAWVSCSKVHKYTLAFGDHDIGPLKERLTWRCSSKSFEKKRGCMTSGRFLCKAL